MITTHDLKLETQHPVWCPGCTFSQVADVRSIYPGPSGGGRGTITLCCRQCGDFFIVDGVTPIRALDHGEFPGEVSR